MIEFMGQASLFDDNACQRWEARIPSWRHTSEGGFNPAGYDVVALDWNTALTFVTVHHYSGAFSSAVRGVDLPAKPYPKRTALAAALIEGEKVITRIIELSCDHDGCDNAYAPSVQELTSLRLTRIGSVVAGWTRRNGLDYCPDHRREDRTDAVRRLAGLGLTDDKIGLRLGCHRAVVQKIRADAGIPPGLGRVGRPAILG